MLQQAFEAGQLDFARETTALAVPSAIGASLTKLRVKDWVVYAKPFLRRFRAGARLSRTLHPSVRHRQRAPLGL
jgi:hypothetical protein